MKHSEQSSPIICLSLGFCTHYVSANSIGIGSVLPTAAYICLSIGSERKLVVSNVTLFPMDSIQRLG